MRARMTIAQIRKKTVILFAMVIFAIDTGLTPRAHASLDCAGLFTSTDSSLPSPLKLLFDQLSPKRRLKFEERFERREEVSAEREASRLIALHLLKSDETNLRLTPLFSKDSRAETIKSLLNARLDVESKRIEIENILIDIGYSEGSQTSQEWRAFRDRNSARLSVAKSVAINMASALTLGLPLFLYKIKTANFKVSKAERRAWPEVEQHLRARIASGEAELIRKIKYEIAVDFVRRIVALAVLAILTDDFLTYVTPKWGLFKMKVRGTLIVESRERLEIQALENWKEIIEAFTGTRPTDDSPEAQEILARIRATSRDDLWLHLHGGGRLSEPQENAPPASLVPQTY